MKFSIAVLWFIFSTSCIFGQSLTTLTGTVTDSDGQLWANASWTARLLVSGGVGKYQNGTLVSTSYTGTLTNSGTFFSASLPDVTQIVPRGATWQITLCALTSAPCQTLMPSAVSGTTYNMGTYLSSIISAPRIQGSHLAYAYNAAEILNSVQGNGYVNTVQNQQYVWNNNGYVATASSTQNVPSSTLPMSATQLQTVLTQGNALAMAVTKSNSILNNSQIQHTLANGCRAFSAGNTYVAMFPSDAGLTMTEYPQFFTAGDVKCLIQAIVQHPNTNGDLPFAVGYNNGVFASASYFDTAWDFYNCASGCSGTHVENDAVDFIPALEALYYQKTSTNGVGGDLTEFAADAPTLETALARTQINPTTGLVTVPASSPYIPWGFQESIRLNGDVLIGSLFYWRDANALANLYTLQGNTTAATRWQIVASKIASSLSTSSPMWDATDGMLYAASGQNKQPDIYGSAMCVSFGLCTGAQAMAISTFVSTNVPNLSVDGFVSPTYVPSTGAANFQYFGNLNADGSNGTQQYPSNAYQNGRWSVADLWIADTIYLTSPSQAAGFAISEIAGTNPFAEWYDVNLGTNSPNGNAGILNLESIMGSTGFLLKHPELAVSYTGASISAGGSDPNTLEGLTNIPGNMVKASAQNYTARLVAEGATPITTTELGNSVKACTQIAAQAFGKSACGPGALTNEYWSWRVDPTTHAYVLYETQTLLSNTPKIVLSIPPTGSTNPINNTNDAGVFYYYQNISLPSGPTSAPCVPNELGFDDLGLERCNQFGTAVFTMPWQGGTTVPTVAAPSGSTAVIATGQTNNRNTFSVVANTGGTAVGAGNFISVIWATAWPLIPNCILSPGNAYTSTLQTYTQANTTTLFIAVNNGIAANSQVVYNVQCK